jgi:hypothetical protein
LKTIVAIGKDIIYLWSPSRRYTAKPVLRDHYRDKEKMSLYDRSPLKTVSIYMKYSMTEKGQKDKQRSTSHAHKTKDRVTRTLLNTGGEIRCSGKVSSPCSTSGTRRIVCHYSNDQNKFKKD